MTERRRQQIIEAVNVVRSITDAEMKELFGRKLNGLKSKPKEKDIMKLSEFEKELMVTKFIINLGIPADLTGYNYVRDAILISINEVYRLRITNEIYPSIAQKYRVTTPKVERAVRHAFKVANSKGDLNLIKEVFGERGIIPSNAKAISIIAEYLKMQQAE